MAFTTQINDLNNRKKAAERVAAKQQETRKWTLTSLRAGGGIRRQVIDFSGTEAQAKQLLHQLHTDTGEA